MNYNAQNANYRSSPPSMNFKMDSEEVKRRRKELGLTQTEFGKVLGKSLQAVQAWEYSRNPIPESVEILLMNLGNTVQEKQAGYRTTNKHGNVFSETTDGQILMEVPIIPYSAHAKYLDEHNEAGFFDEFEKVTFAVDKLAMGNYLGFKVSGDSMNGGRIDDTPDKAIILGRELQLVHWADGFKDSKHGWVLITNKNILFKDITAFDKEHGTIICHSRNDSPEYCDFPLSLSDVHQIFKIIKRTF